MARLISTIALVLLCASPAWAWGIRGSTAGTDSDADITITGHGAAEVDTGDLLTMLVTCNSSASVTVTGITDTDGNTYLNRLRYQAAGKSVEIWTALAVAGGGFNATVTFSGTCTVGQALVIGWTGTFGTLQYPTTSAGAANTTTTSHSCGSVSAINTDLVLAVASKSGSSTDTANASYLAIAASSRTFAQWEDPSGAFTDAGTWTSDSSISTICAQLVIRDGSIALTSSSAWSPLLGGFR